MWPELHFYVASNLADANWWKIQHVKNLTWHSPCKWVLVKVNQKPTFLYTSFKTEKIFGQNYQIQSKLLNTENVLIENVIGKVFLKEKFRLLFVFLQCITLQPIKYFMLTQLLLTISDINFYGWWCCNAMLCHHISSVKWASWSPKSWCTNEIRLLWNDKNFRPTYHSRSLFCNLNDWCWEDLFSLDDLLNVEHCFWCYQLPIDNWKSS